MKSICALLFLFVACWAEDEFIYEHAEIASVEGNLGLERDLRSKTTVCWLELISSN